MTLEEIIQGLIKPEARQEALKIMKLASDENFHEFIQYYNDKSYNVCCLIIDKVKTELVEQNKLTQKPEDHFGEFPYEE